MRSVNKIIIHCSATAEGREVTVKEIDAWHRARGYNGIGYHYVIYLDGTIHVGRPEERVGAHCKGYNSESIGICYIGGLNKKGQPEDTRTPEQKESLLKILKELRLKYPQARIFGHRDFAPKDCPCFEAQLEYEKAFSQ